ncbi:unnamed protein product [Darwinula stevensoni]|uniref:Nedd4 family interacting protein 1 n=1 Tax=Darwinula stevensoni TaxID=69355 RepID=A0A7R9A2A6_9CRUS|nr:unnamed protein product [Darwinula stevensoni]CAG0885282.1 unnamed protein product [Darwinula stevensoni]
MAADSEAPLSTTGIPPPAYEDVRFEEGTTSEGATARPDYQQNQSSATASLYIAEKYSFLYFIFQNEDDESIPPPKVDCTAPPTYEVATSLPSYDEVRRQKYFEEHPQAANARYPPYWRTFLHVDLDGATEQDEALLGTDFIFFASFFVAFLFNWVGFLLLICFCQTIAGRYGALAGFGLSLAKWTLIVKHSTDLVNHENNWLWWLIMAFGLLICLRAIFQYISIKREWHVLTRAAQERLLFFY